MPRVWVSPYAGLTLAYDGSSYPIETSIFLRKLKTWEAISENLRIRCIKYRICCYYLDSGLFLLLESTAGKRFVLVSIAINFKSADLDSMILSFV